MHLMSVIIIKRGQIPGNLKLDWDQDLLITLTSASFFDERRIYLRQMSVYSNFKSADLRDSKIKNGEDDILGVEVRMDVLPM